MLCHACFGLAHTSATAQAMVFSNFLTSRCKEPTLQALCQYFVCNGPIWLYSRQKLTSTLNEVSELITYSFYTPLIGGMLLKSSKISVGQLDKSLVFYHLCEPWHAKKKELLPNESQLICKPVCRSCAWLQSATKPQRISLRKFSFIFLLYFHFGLWHWHCDSRQRTTKVIAYYKKLI